MNIIKNSTYIILSSLLLLGGCKSIKKEFLCDEGEITYTVEYLESAESNPLISLLPEELKMIFKNDNISMNVEGWMGIFKSGFLRTGRDKNIFTLMKVLNKKYYYKNIDSNNFMGLTSYLNIEVQFDDSTKRICDICCKHAIVRVPSKDLIFDVFYTTEIDIKDANFGTPFAQIPGVLMEFQLDMNNIPMHITASEIKYIDIENNIFDIPEGYECVDKEIVDELIASLLN